ncbi:uncharacterized protein LOC135262899 [Anguilla rostrata]|uniref:uncharacterized protein LOC135262899 n=1 Tax=Anguilla rostrata TaxID=7938 RepID=UPI0030D5D539
MAELSTDRRFHNLTQKQVQTLDQVLTEVIPIHGRGNFPTLEVKPKDIIHVVKNRLVKREIKVRDVRLNGSTASHVLVKENGTSYKDLDIIFGVELPRQEDFQIIKEVVLGCLLDFLPQGVNKDKITALTMKEAYVQKMVKVFNEHDRWSLISLSNNRGKNVELKFVNSLRRQFEFSVDSFQIILDRMLESYLEAERKQVAQCHTWGEEASSVKSSSQVAPNEESPSTSLDQTKPTNKAMYLPAEGQDLPSLDERPCENEEVVLQEDELPQPMEVAAETLELGKVTKIKEPGQDLESLKGAEVELQESDAEVQLDVLPLLEKGVETSVPEAHGQTEESLETVIPPSSETPAHTELSRNSVQVQKQSPKDTLNECPSSIESTVMEEPGRLTVPCDHSHPQPCTILTEEAQISHLEYPLPPPPKKTCKKSKMVVLKHSSPKPPRKMSKKVINTPPSPKKTPLVNELPILTNTLLDPPKIIFKAQSNESMPIEELNCNIISPQSNTNTSLDKECQVQTVLFQNETSVAHDTEYHVETKCLQNQEPEPARNQEPEPAMEKTFPQRAEPEYGDKHQDPADQHPDFSAQPMDSQKDTTPMSQSAPGLSPPRELPTITVVAESMYGDFEQAMEHLRYRLIATRNPEEIRGGGLLKYSNLLVRDFKPASETEIKSLERYMCSRFFIDFPDVHEQQRKIESYLRNHFIGEESSKYDYLMTLRRVVNESTVCLMGHERRQTLNMITVLALKVLGEQNAIPNTTNITCFYQPAPYMADHNFNNYYIAQNQPTLIYHPYPLHIHMQTGLV